MDLLIPGFRSDRTDLLVADHAFFVDHKGFGNAVNTEVDADFTGRILDGEVIRIAALAQKAHSVGIFILVVQADDRDDLLAALADLNHGRMFLTAGSAP